jgi:hypothetical protein
MSNIFAILLGDGRKREFIFTLGSLSTLFVLLYTILISNTTTLTTSLLVFENTILLWAFILSSIILIYRRCLKNNVSFQDLAYLDGIVIILILLTIIEVDSGVFNQSLSSIVLLLIGYSLTMISGIHILSNKIDSVGEILAKAAWVFIGTSLILEIVSIIQFSSQTPFNNIFQAPALLPWIFLSAFFHSKSLGLWARRFSIELVVLGLLFSAYYVFSGSTSIPNYPTSNFAFILLLPSIFYLSLLFQRIGKKFIINIKNGNTLIWTLFIGLGIYIFVIDLFSVFQFPLDKFFQITLIDYFYFSGFLISGLLLINKAVSSLLKKALTITLIIVAGYLLTFSDLSMFSNIVIFSIPLFIVSSISAIYSTIKKRIMILSLLSFVTFSTLTLIYFGGFFSTESVNVKLNDYQLTDDEEIEIFYRLYEFQGLRDIKEVPNIEIEVPRKAVTIIELNVSSNEFSRLIRIPVVYDRLDDLSGQSSLSGDTIIISYGLNDLYISINPNSEILNWFRLAYQGAIIGERYDSPLNNLELQIRQSSFIIILMIGLLALIMIGAYILPNSIKNGEKTSESFSKV